MRGIEDGNDADLRVKRPASGIVTLGTSLALSVAGPSDNI